MATNFNVASANPNSTLTKDQELNIAATRKTPTDITNVNYAKAQGWAPTAPVSLDNTMNKGGVQTFADGSSYNPATGEVTGKPGQGTAPTAPVPTTTPSTLTSDKTTAEVNAANTDLANLKAQNAADLTASTERINVDYDRQLTERKTQQEEERATEGAVQFRLGQSGTNYAADQTSRQNVKRNAALDALLREKQSLIAAAERAARDGDTKALSETRKYIYDLNTKQDELTRQESRDKMSDYLALSGLDIQKENAGRQNKLADYTIAKAQSDLAQDVNIGETKDYTLADGTKMTIVGEKVQKGFWDDAAIQSLIKELPMGQTRAVWDPILKQNIEIKGMGDVKNGYKQFETTDNSGTVRVTTIDPATGKAISVANLGKIGKTGGSGTNVSVNMPSYGSSPNNVYDKSGKFVGTQRYDSKSAKLIKQDVNGNSVENWPADSTLDKPKEDTGGWGGILE